MTTEAITEQAIATLTTILGLRTAMPYTQNWPAEVAEPDELSRYLDCYQSVELNAEDKYALMSLILYALESATKVSTVELPTLMDRVRAVLEADSQLHLPHLLYWSLPEEESDDSDFLFCITPFIRGVMNRLSIRWNQSTESRDIG